MNGMRARTIGWGMVAAGVVTTLAAVVLVVWTHLGQRADEASRWSVRVSWRGRSLLGEWLGLVSVEFIAVVLAIVVLVALARRQVSRALVAVVVVAGSNVGTQVFKALVPRPDMGIGSENTLPSGHVTVVTSLVLATLFVVPASWRSVVAVLAAGAGTLTGAATLIHRWHRPSDVVAAYAMCAVFAGVALVLGDRDTARPDASLMAPFPVAGAGRRRGFLGYGICTLTGAALAGVFLVLVGLVANEEPIDGIVGGVVLTAMGVTCAVVVALAGVGLERLTPAVRRRHAATVAGR